MTAMFDMSGLAVLVTALTGTISAIGVILIAFLNRKVAQVEKQGNSVSLELKRTNAVYARRLAVATRDKADIAIAKDAEEAYRQAIKANERL